MTSSHLLLTGSLSAARSPSCFAISATHSEKGGQERNAVHLRGAGSCQQRINERERQTVTNRRVVGVCGGGQRQTGAAERNGLKTLAGD